MIELVYVVISSGALPEVDIEVGEEFKYVIKYVRTKDIPDGEVEDLDMENCFAFNLEASHEMPDNARTEIMQALCMACGGDSIDVEGCIAAPEEMPVTITVKLSSKYPAQRTYICSRSANMSRYIRRYVLSVISQSVRFADGDDTLESGVCKVVDLNK